MGEHYFCAHGTEDILCQQYQWEQTQNVEVSFHLRETRWTLIPDSLLVSEEASYNKV